MLPKIELVKKALEMLDSDLIDVYEYIKIKKNNGSTSYEEVKTLENIKCRISFDSTPIVNNNGVASTQNQNITLFIHNDIDIRPNSKIVATIKGKKSDIAYKSSSIQKHYDSHNEIKLEIFDKWT